jgi:cysteine-rich repeat protein
MTSVAHCGACGNVCPDKYLCDAGVCAVDSACEKVTCAEGTECRGGVCVASGFCGDGIVQAELGEECDDGTNAGDPGGCDVDCLIAALCGDFMISGDEQCDDGNLVSGDGCSEACEVEPNYACPPDGGPCVFDDGLCPGDLVDCGGVCTDLMTNAMNCGGCGIVCDAGQTCSQGICNCQAGLVMCAGNCVDVMSDPVHCGACSAPCGTSEICVAGVCEPALSA